MGTDWASQGTGFSSYEEGRDERVEKVPKGLTEMPCKLHKKERQASETGDSALDKIGRLGSETEDAWVGKPSRRKLG